MNRPPRRHPHPSRLPEWQETTTFIARGVLFPQDDPSLATAYAVERTIVRDLMPIYRREEYVEALLEHYVDLEIARRRAEADARLRQAQATQQPESES